MTKLTDREYFHLLQEGFYAAMGEAGGAAGFEEQPGETLGASMDVRPEVIIRALTWVMAMTIAQYAEGNDRRRDIEDQRKLLGDFLAIADGKLAAFREASS